MPPLDYALLNEEVAALKVGNRTDGAALLAWFLESVWRLDPEDVPTAICDGPSDKGIDALIVDEDAAEIIVFQSKWRQDPAKSTQGDSEIKAFVGVSDYFKSVETFDALLSSSPNIELKQLLSRQKVRDQIADEATAVRLVFVTNAELDTAGQGYIDARATLSPPIEIFTGMTLIDIAEQTQRPALRPESVVLSGESAPIVASLTQTERMAISLIPASQLIKLPGIADQTLFSRNVRYSVGRTRINNALRETVLDNSEHRLFPAFHNGLTLLTEKLDPSGNDIRLKGVGVVNGCQSLTTLYQEADHITDSLSLLVKVVEVPSDGRVADKITYRSNNQNAVTLRDQRSNDKASRALQAEINRAFGGQYFLQLKQGENRPAGAVALDVTTVAQVVMAIYLSEPWSAIRKLRLFDEDFRRIFSKSLTAHRAILAFRIDQALLEQRGNLRADLVSSYAAIRFTLLHLVAQLLRESPAGMELLATPEKWINNPDTLAEVDTALEDMIDEVINTVNFFVDERADDPAFDPKVTFKSQAGVKRLEQDVIRDAARQAKRGTSYLFSVSPTGI